MDPFFTAALVPVGGIRAHEETYGERVCRVKEDILREGVILTPLLLDREFRVLLNGHHRLAALKEIGCHLAPCLLLDYFSSVVQVRVCPGSGLKRINKEEVRNAAVRGELFPPRSSLHILSRRLPDFPTPLARLMPHET